MAAAFFDLDGTLITANSARLYVGRERRLGRLSRGDVARALVFLGFYRLGIADIEAALAGALKTLQGRLEDEVRADTERWWSDEVARFEAPGARAAIERHRAAGDRVVLLTSSSPYAAEAARRQFGLEHSICTTYGVSEGRFTGRVEGPICFGPGKVTMAAAWAASQGLSLADAAFYSDSATDRPMLAAVGRPVVVNPDPPLRVIARWRGWPVADWSRAQAPDTARPPST